MKKIRLMLLIFAVLTTAVFLATVTASAELSPSGTVLADNDEIFICITGFKYEQENDTYTVEVYIENRCDVAIEAGAEKVGVNGIIVDGYMYDVMAAGRKSIAYLSISASTLRQLEMDPDCITFSLYANKTYDGTMRESIVNTDAAFYPEGTAAEEIKSKSFDDFPITQFDFENEFIRVRELDARPMNGDFIYQIDFLVENKCDFDFNLDFGNFRINGSDMSVYCYCLIPAGMKAVAHAWVSADEMGDINVYDVDTVSATLLLYEHADGALSGMADSPFFAYPIHFNPAKG